MALRREFCGQGSVAVSQFSHPPHVDRANRAVQFGEGRGVNARHLDRHTPGTLLRYAGVDAPQEQSSQRTGRHSRVPIVVEALSPPRFELVPTPQDRQPLAAVDLNTPNERLLVVADRRTHTASSTRLQWILRHLLECSESTARPTNSACNRTPHAR